MTCSQAEYLSPLYWSGELEAQAIAELESHLKECAECAHEFELQQHTDEVLRDMVLAEPVDDVAVRERVRESLWPARTDWHVLAKRTLASAAGIAALAALSFGIWSAVATRSNSVPVVYADAAQDHYDEVVKQYPRGWLTSPAEIKAFVKEHAGDESVIAALAPAGYHIDKVRLCELELSNYVHLVYSDGDHDISFFIRQRDGEKLGGETALNVKGASIHSEQVTGLYVAGFQSPRYTILVVSGQSQERSLHFAVNAANAVLEDQSFNLPVQVRGMALDKAAA
jgi:anti-sigma factor RsiW